MLVGERRAYLACLLNVLDINAPMYIITIDDLGFIRPFVRACEHVSPQSYLI